MMELLCLLAMASCAFQSGQRSPAPAPPSAAVLPAAVAEGPQIEALKSAIDEVVTEVEEHEQLEKAAEAREQFDTLVRERELDEEQVAALRRWVAWTAYTRFDFGDQGFLSDYIVSGESATFRQRYPRVLNDTGLTTTQAWVDALLLPTDPHHKVRNAAKEIIHLRNGLAVQPDSGGFVHIDLATMPVESLLRDGDTYDDVIVTLINADSEIATRALMRLTPATDEERAQSVQVLVDANSIYTYSVVAKSKLDLKRGKIPPAEAAAATEELRARVEAALLELAENPYWPVHLTTLDMLAAYRRWFDGADTTPVLDRLRAHDDPITDRWIRDHAASYR